MFVSFKNAVAKQFEFMQTVRLYRTAVTKQQLWDTYLASFPAGTNPMYRSRTEYDCNCCKSFIRAVGNTVAIVDGKLVSIWDGTVEEPFQTVANALSQLVKSAPIENLFYHTEPRAGTNKSLEQLVSGTVTWNHFFITLPKALVIKNSEIGTKLGDLRSTYDVLSRGLRENKLSAVDMVLELIAQNSLYKGQENNVVVSEFRKLKAQYDKLKTDEQKDIFCWSLVGSVSPAITRLRNTAIGTLITDLSEGYDLEDAVKSFEQKVAPTNYKRPTALVTKAMIQKAEKAIKEMGYLSALERRYATVDDITINNVLFANRETKKAMSVFDEMAASVPENTRSLGKVEEVTIDKFLADILPKIDSLEVMVENRHSSNLVSLIAPVDPTANIMFKWDNNFSWSYVGEVTDSIKERVKKAGGNVTGDLRCSLSWFNTDDLDLYMREPNGNLIYFRNKVSPYTGGQLDVDMNAHTFVRDPVENIVYPNRIKMLKGDYVLSVNSYRKRENIDVGFEVEVEFDSDIYHFSNPKAVPEAGTVIVARITCDGKGNFTIKGELLSKSISKQVWGLQTETFQKVNMVMLSPNYWDEKTVGNKHFFFMLDHCLNDGTARGFFNEFLKQELEDHRKVFEMVGAKMKIEGADRQLSGLGFSSTRRNTLIARVKGTFTRTLKITF